jgi:hypothetical protein
MKNAAPTMLEHRRGLEPKPERAERAGFRHATQTYQPTRRENSRVAHATQNPLV